MKYLANSHDPEHEFFSQSILVMVGQTKEGAVKQYREYLSDKIIGMPQATEQYSVELVAMNMVGVYTYD